VDGVLQFTLVATAPRSDGLLDGISHSITDRCSEGWPWCVQWTLGPEKVSATTLNSTRPGRRTPLIMYLLAEVMPKCPSRARSLPIGIRASALKDSLLSAYLYSFLPSSSLWGRTLHRLSLHYRRHGPPTVAAPQQVRLELPDYQVPLAQSQKAPTP
jgi:hypothetical protein